MRAFLLHERHLMKTITTTAPIRKADPALDAALNPVALASGEIVSWAVAFPRRGSTSPVLADRSYGRLYDRSVEVPGPR